MTSFAMFRIDLRGRTMTAAQLRAALPRGGVDVDSVVPTVRPIVDDVIERGAIAALEYGEKFDGVRSPAVRVPADDLAAALAALDPEVRAALEVAIDRTRAVHADQRRTDTTTLFSSGASVTGSPGWPHLGQHARWSCRPGCIAGSLANCSSNSSRAASSTLPP